MSTLADKRCAPCSGDTPALELSAASKLCESLRPEWQLLEGGKLLRASFSFKNYYHTQAFVNAVAYVAHREDHHPDISFGYRSCTVSWWTHAVNGLTENDFICAAKVDQLLS
jgi:4a-hydroxytetrahydrobiopterin dehydratase